jgi:hypothetical protein
VPEDNPDQIGRGLSAPGSQPVNAEKLLAELVRLVESPALAPERPPPPVEIAPPPASLEASSTKPKETIVADVRPTHALRSSNSHSGYQNRIGSAAGPRSGAGTFWVSALVLAAAVGIGAIFWLKSEVADGPALIAAAQSPTPMQWPANVSGATSSDAEASPPKDASQPAEDKALSPEERPTDPSAHASPENSAASRDVGPAGSAAAQQTAPAAGAPPAAAVNTTTPAASAAAAPESLDSKAAPAVSLPPEPTPPATIPTATATPTPAATDSGLAAQPTSAAPLPPVRPTPKAAVQADRAPQRSTPKPDAPAKPSSQSAAHAVAKAGATGPGAPEAKTIKSAQASVEPQATLSAPPAPAPQQPNPNLVARAVGTVVGAVNVVTGLIPFVGH